MKLVAAVLVALSVAAGAGATTQPGMLFVTRLVLTDHAILVRGDKFVGRGGIPDYPRGTEVRYEVLNRASHALSLDVLGSTTGRIAPGRTAPILVYWARRGTFTFRAQPRGPRIRMRVE